MVTQTDENGTWEVKGSTRYLITPTQKFKDSNPENTPLTPRNLGAEMDALKAKLQAKGTLTASDISAIDTAATTEVVQ